MGDGGRISWGRLVLGVTLALGIAAAVAVLIGPLVAMSVADSRSFFSIRGRVSSVAITPATARS